MTIRRFHGAHKVGLAAAVALAVGVGTAGAASASQSGSASVANDTLTVNGTHRSERLALRLAPGDPNTLQVDFGDDGLAEQSFDRSTFGNITVFLRSGSDTFRVDQVNGAFADEVLTIHGGSGGDTIDGGDGNELIVGGSGSDTVNGHRGSDTAHLGSGRDSFRWDPGDGSDIVNGDSGTDTLIFFGSNQAEEFTMATNGSRELFVRNLGTIRMDMDDVEILALSALAGADTVTINDMTGTDFRLAEVDLSASVGGGDDGADVVTVSGTEKDDRIDVRADGTVIDVDGRHAETRITGAEPTDRLQVNSLGGNDTVDVADAVNALIAVGVDLGTGQS